MSNSTARTELHVRQIRDGEVEAGFDVLRATAQFLINKGRRQRISNTTLAEYESWQAQAGNFGIFEADHLVGIYTLVKEPLSNWPQTSIEGDVLWLRALATHPDHRGKQIGAFGIQTALDTLNAGEELYLDCVSDFLPDYYAKQGFSLVAERTLIDEAGETWEITLMKQVG